jgi:hypothetical protein
MCRGSRRGRSLPLRGSRKNRDNMLRKTCPYRKGAPSGPTPFGKYVLGGLRRATSPKCSPKERVQHLGEEKPEGRPAPTGKVNNLKGQVTPLAGVPEEPG